MVKVSVIIVNYNVSAFLYLCLQSVTKALKSVVGEIIVVDNNSTDDSCAMVKKRYPEVILIENKDNTGFSKANNQAVKIAKGEYLLILNPDTFIPENTFQLLLNFVEEKALTGAVGAAMYDGLGEFLPESKRRVPYPKVALKKLMGFGQAYYASDIAINDIGQVPVLTGAFMFITKDAYQNVGGFDERYFMYGEDIDLSYTLTQFTYKNYYFPKVKIIHFKGESSVKDEIYLTHFYQAMQLFYQKHFKSYQFFEKLIKSSLKIKKYVHRKSLENNEIESKTLENILYIGSENKVINALELYFSTAQVHKYTVCQKAKHSLLENLKKVEEIIEKNNCRHLVFDTQNNSFENIISYMISLKAKYSYLTFSIRPSHGTALIVSSHMNSQGQVIDLKI